MPVPTMITISGTYLKMDSSPEEGTVVFRTPVYVLHGDSSTVMVPSEITATLNGAGFFTMSVPATDDPDWTPVGWAYKISVNLGESATTYHAEVPYNSPGGAISISDMLPVAATSGTMYATLNHEHTGYVTEANVDSVVAAAVASELTNYAPIASPVFTGTLTVPGPVNIGTSGTLNIGADTNIYRVGANHLATDDGFDIGGDSRIYGNLQVDGTVTGIDKSDVGLANVDNTSDLSKPISTATQTALDGKSATSHNHDSTYVRKDIATSKGDLLVASGSGVFVRLGVGTDGQVLKANSVATNGVEWGTDGGGGGGAVDSVNGYTGIVVLTKSDVGLANVDNTADTAKPISTATQTALDGKQDLDSDLTAIAALAPTNDDVIQRKAGAWTNRTMAQVKTDLALTKSDVGLSNIDNTSDASKPVSTATQTALDGKQAIDSDLTTIAGLTATTDNVIQSVAGAWASRTPAQLKTTLALAKADVGLSSVDNTADTAKPVSTAQATAIALKPDLKAWNGSSYSAISNGVIYVGGTSDPTVNNGDIWIDTQSATDFTVTNNLTVGGNLSVTGIGARITKYRTADHAGRTSATPTADDMLTTTLSVGIWMIEVALATRAGTASDTTCDFIVAYTVPTGVAINRLNLGPNATLTAVASTADKTFLTNAGFAPTTSLTYGTNGTNGEYVQERLLYNVTTSGTFAVNWSRAGGSGTAILGIGSHFTAERVA